MLSCLSNSIGVRGCGTQDPSSGLFINDLPGNCGIEQMDKLTEEDQSTWFEVWEAINQRARVRLSNLFYGALKECYQIKTKQCSDDLLCKNVEALYVCFQYLLGEELMNTRIFSTRWNKFTISSDKAKEQKKYFNEMCLIELQISVKTIEVDKTSECFSSGGGSVQFITVLP